MPGPVPATAPALTARPPRPPSRRLSLPPLPPASPRGRGIVLGRKHTLLEPQIKGSIPRPASQWSLCAEESLRGARAQAEREGPEEGAQDKDTCHPETLMFKEAPGGGWTPARCRKMQMEKSRCVQKKTLVPVVSEGGDINGWVHGLRPLPGVGAARAKAAWNDGVAATSPWAQRQEEASVTQMGSLKKGRDAKGDSFTFSPMARRLGHFCLQ